MIAATPTAVRNWLVTLSFLVAAARYESMPAQYYLMLKQG